MGPESLLLVADESVELHWGRGRSCIKRPIEKPGDLLVAKRVHIPDSVVAGLDAARVDGGNASLPRQDDAGKILT